jgi:hypothetical protein
MDWLKRLFNEPVTLGVLVSSGMIGFAMGAVNGIIQRKHGGWQGFFSALFVGAGVALIVGLGIQDYVKSETFRLAIIGACAVVSDDIWAGLKTLGQGLRSDPLGSIFKVIDALRGKAPTPPPPTSPDNNERP